MKDIENIKLLKKLAVEAEKLTPEDITLNPHYRQAYKQIAAGAGLLWRLLDAREDGGKGRLVLK